MARILSFNLYSIDTFGVHEGDLLGAGSSGEKSYLDEHMGIMYNRAKGRALFCAPDGNSVGVEVSGEPEIWEIMNSLGGVSPSEWSGMLKAADYVTMTGEDYFS